MEDGYDIDRQYDCVTKRSAISVAEQNAQWEAANTPEAKAARQAEFDRRAAESNILMAARAKDQAEARAEREQRHAIDDAAPITSVEINTASELELAGLQGLGADVAQQIVVEREKRSFSGWPDVTQRVTALKSAEVAVRASAFGLTVNGLSFDGAEPDSAMGRFLRNQWRRRGG